MNDEAAGEAVQPDWLLSQMPADVVASFTAEQRAALWAASRLPSWRRYPVNIRLWVPLFGRRYFVTIVGGSERRNEERRRRERLLHPLRTVANLAFLLTVGGVFLLGAFVLALLVTRLIEF